MKKIGMVGWRGMVGSVLIKRMLEEGDFDLGEYYFFSTSSKGSLGPSINGEKKVLLDAYDLDELVKMDIVVTAQGSEYTKIIYEKLMNYGFKGHWVDAASYLRAKNDSIIILDPVNKFKIDEGLKNKNRTWVGGNCTVSLMLMAIHGLIEKNLIEWISTMTYQAISGAGSSAMAELFKQSGQFSFDKSDPIDFELKIREYALKISSDNPIGGFLNFNLFPYIDQQYEDGRSKEEWKSDFELKKIIGIENISIDGTCVRVPTLRCHCQALTIKLNKNIALDEIEQIIGESNSWVKIIPNDRISSLKNLHPMNVSSSLDILVGRIRKMNFGKDYLNLFTIGDQLLWGASEPIRRMVKILLAP